MGLGAFLTWLRMTVLFVMLNFVAEMSCRHMPPPLLPAVLFSNRTRNSRTDFPSHRLPCRWTAPPVALALFPVHSRW